MLKSLIISVDVMGGSNAPDCVLEALNEVISHRKNVSFLLFGKKEQVARKLNEFPLLETRCEFIHCDEVLSDHDSPIKAFKTGKNTSMYQAIIAVKEGRADACVSSGNTGALMVISKMLLGMLPNIKRPAICSIFPNKRHGSVMLDLGANTDCDPFNLLQFGVMGHCFANVVKNQPNPTIGILNIGTEDYKGRELDRKAAELLSESDLNYHGFVEGHDIAEGVVDVVVTDGFSGNIALKIAEGTAKTCLDYMKKGFLSSFISRIGALLVKRSITKSFNLIDPRNYNGAMFTGVNGIVIKSHGSSDAKGFQNALKVAIKLTENDINTKLSEAIIEYQASKQNSSFANKIKQYLIEKVK